MSEAQLRERAARLIDACFEAGALPRDAVVHVHYMEGIDAIYVCPDVRSSGVYGGCSCPGKIAVVWKDTFELRLDADNKLSHKALYFQRVDA